MWENVHTQYFDKHIDSYQLADHKGNSSKTLIASGLLQEHQYNKNNHIGCDFEILFFVLWQRKTKKKLIVFLIIFKSLIAIHREKNSVVIKWKVVKTGIGVRVLKSTKQMQLYRNLFKFTNFGSLSRQADRRTSLFRWMFVECFVC